ncbi:MAG: pectinesterase family protein [Verrucomicrobiota bacterium]
MMIPAPDLSAVLSRWWSSCPAMFLAAAFATVPAIGQTINVDLNSSTTASDNYTGLGLVPGDTGTVWNALNVTNSTSPSVTVASGSVKDSLGSALPGVSITLAAASGNISRFSTTANTTPNPAALMKDYTFSGTYNVTVAGLTPGTYKFWYFGHGDQANQTGTVMIDGANGGGTGSTENSALGRDLVNGGEGVSYASFTNKTVGAGGTFTFQVANYLNGFQLQRATSGPVDPRPSIFADAGATAYSGTAVAVVPGSTWNQLPGSASPSYTITNVLAATGSTVAGVNLTVASSGSGISTYGADSPGNPNPLNLMRDYFFGANFTLSLSGLPQGNYYLYVFAHGDQPNQNSTVTVAAGNGGGSGVTSATGTDNRDLFAPNAEGYSYLKFTPTVGAAGTLSFTANGYFTGFQLVPYPAPAFTVQPPPTPTATLNSDFSMTAIATGPGSLTYRWRKAGVDLADGPTGNGSNYSGCGTNTLTIQNVQNGDAGNFDAVVTNPGGTATSNTAEVAVTSTPQAPVIALNPGNSSVPVNGTANMNVVVNGTSPITYDWYKGVNLLENGTTASGAVISGAHTAYISITNVQLADAGAYHLVATNSVSSATSTSGTLTVTMAPTITTQPVGGIVAISQQLTLSPTYGVSAPTPAYQWQFSMDGVAWSNAAGGTTASLTLTGSQAASGFYRVTATNSVGSVTSRTVYFGIPSTQQVTFAPGNNATKISTDQQLRLTFPGAPKLGVSGAIKIRDAANDSVVATIDSSQFVSYTPGNASAVIPNAAIRSVQGSSFYYMPMAIYGNEVWITLSPTQRLAFGKTYYVTMDSALVLDSSNAAYPGVTAPTTWRFSTKASGPATPTASTGLTSITVGQDGTGDFATFQGAFDWVPQNNTLARTIHVKPGFYRDSATLAQNRNFVTITGDGASRTDVQFIYPFAYFAPPNSIFTAGSLRIESSDVTVRDMTLDNIIYKDYHPTGKPDSGAVGAFAGAINTLATTGKRIVCDNVLIKGGQDTIYNNSGIIYYNNCEVWGSVDFIYGAALAVFDQCKIVEIRNSGGPITAPNTAAAQPYGLTFLNCTFPRALIANGYPYDVNTASSTFQRPWGKDGATAIINCQIGTQISTKGWGEWDGRENTCRNREYGSTAIGGGVTSTPAQRQMAGGYWLNTIDPDYVSNPSLTGTEASLAPPGNSNRDPVTVNPADYTLAAIFGNAYFNLSGWLPSLIPRMTTQPVGQSVNPGQSVTFTAAATGTPAPTYQWYINGAAINGATSASYNIPSAGGANWGSYTVVAGNSAGTATSNTATLTFSDPQANYMASHGLDPATTGAPLEDPDNDGTCNKLEFFLGGNPAVAQPGIVPSCHISQGPDAFVFEFDRNTAASAVAYVVEHTPDLGSAWSPVVHGQDGAAIVVTPVNATKDHVTVTIPRSANKDFARLRLP